MNGCGGRWRESSGSQLGPILSPGTLNIKQCCHNWGEEGASGIQCLEHKEAAIYLTVHQTVPTTNYLALNISGPKQRNSELNKWCPKLR